MQRVKVALVGGLCVVVALAAIVFARPAGTHAVSPATSCGSWTVVTSPNPGTNNVLDGVAALTKNDIWAVGYTDNQTLTEHWNGSAWSAITSVNPTGQDALVAVAAISSTNVWAVGFSGSDVSNNARTLTEQWNGSNWSVVPSPTPGVSADLVAAARIPGRSQVWAVGHAVTGGGIDQTLIELWNGTSWSVVPSPNRGVGGSDFLGVTAISANNAWAVGTYSDKKGNFKTLTEHWDGKTWSVVSSPNVANNGVLWAVSQVPGTNTVWAAGSYVNSKGIAQTLTMVWKGEEWVVIASPNVKAVNNTFFGVSAGSASDIWAVGLTYDNSGANAALTEHWNGSQWTIVSTPNVEGDSILTAVTNVPASALFWAVGVSYGGGGSHTVTQYICSKGD